MIYFTLLIFAIILSHVQYMISKFNLHAPWSGYGAIAGVLNKSSDAPMVYRVLVPWLIGKNISLWKYEIWQTILIMLSLVSIYTAWNISIVYIAIILLTVTFWYDYWDWTIELIGFSLALVSLPLAMFGVMLLALSRETAPLVGVVYALHSHDYLGGLLISLIGIFILFFVRKEQGYHPLYCKRWMIKENIQLLRNGDAKSWLSIGLILLGLLAIPTALQANYGDVLIIPVIVVLGLSLAKVNETRVFVSITPYAALFISGLLK